MAKSKVPSKKESGGLGGVVGAAKASVANIGANKVSYLIVFILGAVAGYYFF
jgi:hypothetical protein